MSSTAIVTVLCPDRTGLVSAITRTIWETGANLADTSFSVLGAGADFSAICELPDGLEVADLERTLAALPELDGADLAVAPYRYDPLHGPEGDVTHRITVTGGDQPGLVARLCEAMIEYRANIVTLNAGPLADDNDRYVIRLAVSIPGTAADACLATVKNTAEAMGLTCRAEAF